MLILNIRYDWFNSLTTLYIITYMVIDKVHTFYGYNIYHFYLPHIRVYRKSLNSRRGQYSFESGFNCIHNLYNCSSMSPKLEMVMCSFWESSSLILYSLKWPYWDQC